MEDELAKIQRQVWIINTLGNLGTGESWHQCDTCGTRPAFQSD